MVVARSARRAARGDARSNAVRWRTPMLLVVALALAACGGDEGLMDEVAQESADPEPTEEPDAEEPDEPDVTDDADDTGDTDTAQETGTDDDGSGLASHRPPDDLDVEGDCETIDTEAPGAFIAFPSDAEEAWLDAGDGPVTVEFVGCSNTFEANVQYEAYHGQDARPTLEGHTMGGSYGDWRAFGFEETFWTPGDWTVMVFELDAESGDRLEYDQVVFSVG